MEQEQSQEISKEQAIEALVNSPSWKYVEEMIRDYFLNALLVVGNRDFVAQKTNENIGADVVAIQAFAEKFGQFLTDVKFVKTPVKKEIVNRMR